MAKGTAVASLLVQIGADISGLEAGGKQGAKAMQNLGKHARDLGNQMAALGAAAAAAGAAMLAGLVKAGIDSIDTQAKLARNIGGTIDGLRGLQIALGDAGVSNESLTGDMEKLNARLGEAQRGTGKAKDALDLLGLSARALAQMDVDQRLAVIADRVVALGLSSSQTADVLRSLGIRTGEMVDALRAGGDAIRAARQEVDDFGLSVSAVDAAKVEAANDAMERIGRVTEGVKNQLAIAFAPMLQELADRFNNMAKEHKGFGSQAIATAEAIATGIGKVADTIHVLYTAFKGIELVVTTLKATQITVAEAIVRLWAGVGDAIIAVVNGAIRGLNALGASIDEIKSPSQSAFVVGLKEMGAASRAEIGQVRMEMLDLVTAEWPSDKVARFFDDVRARSQAAAEAMAAVQGGGGTFVSTDEEAEGKAKKDEERRQKELEAQREALVDRLNQIIEFAATEDELELARHEEQLETLRASLEAELITEEEFHIAKQLLEEKHQAKMSEIQIKGMSERDKFLKMSFGNQAKFVAGYLADMTAGVARENKAMFELNKIAGIAQASVSTYQGMAKALEWGFPLGPIFAGIIGAAGFAQVKAIASQHFGGGGGGAAPSLAGGTPATPVTPVSGGTPASAGGGGILTVEGVSPDALFSGRTVRALAERLAEYQRDGGTVQFA